MYQFISIKEVFCTCRKVWFRKKYFCASAIKSITWLSREIVWNDVPLASLSREAIRKQAVLVDNHGYLYANSIRENLLIGNPAANDSDLWNVLEQVSLADFVRKLPEQLVRI